jgi:nicotinamide-nucleotide amidase
MVMVFSEDLVYRAERLLSAARGKGVRMATAESCTGGLIAALLTEIPGSSDVFERGFVTYSNAAKTEMLDVAAELIREHGAVSPEVARAMAEGAIARSAADLAVAVTGVAGPGGGTPAKPVGLVEFACAARGDVTTLATERLGDLGRNQIRMSAVATALSLFERALGGRS